jgi:hypothetical protein
VLKEDSGPRLLKPEDHWHEEGEDRTQCANCRLEEEAAKMSRFELACWNWYHANVNSLVLAGGALGWLIWQERLKGATKRLFVQAQGMIHDMYERISAEAMKARKEG